MGPTFFFLSFFSLLFYHSSRVRLCASPPPSRLPVAGDNRVVVAMAGSTPLRGRRRMAWGTDGDGSSQTRPPPHLAGAQPPRGISGDRRPPRLAEPTSASKKRCSTFVAPTGPASPRPGGVLPRQILDATVDPGSVQPCQVPDTGASDFWAWFIMHFCKWLMLDMAELWVGTRVKSES